jgi:hypothetical protein
MSDKDFIRGQRMKMNIYDDFDDFLTQRQIDEILPPFDINEEMRLITELDAEYAASLND